MALDDVKLEIAQSAEQSAAAILAEADAEVREIMAHNRQFQVKSATEQWFNELFDIATDESDGEWLTSAAIFGSIRRSIGSCFHGNLTTFGRVLSHLEGIHQKHSNIGKLYLVRRKS